MDLSDIAVLRTVLFFVKPLNTGPDVIPDRCNQCCKAVTASISLSSMAGMEITWPCPALSVLALRTVRRKPKRENCKSSTCKEAISDRLIAP